MKSAADALGQAATQAPHYKAVDEMVGTKTHEFAAIPISDRTTLGVLTLVNRATLQDQPVPFEIGELRRGEALARDMAQPIALLSGLVGGTEFSSVRFGGDADKAAGVYKGTTPLTAEDIAETVGWLVSLPEHVNINRVEMMPTCQAPGPLAIKRG